MAKVLRLCPCASVSLFVCRALLELLLQREMGGGKKKSEVKVLRFK